MEGGREEGLSSGGNAAVTRARSGGSYGHRILRERADEYVISWRYDRYYAGSRLRHPTGRSRDTNRKGAKRFAKRWNIEMPKEPTP